MNLTLLLFSNYGMIIPCTEFSKYLSINYKEIILLRTLCICCALNTGEYEHMDRIMERRKRASKVNIFLVDIDFKAQFEMERMTQIWNLTI